MVFVIACHMLMAIPDRNVFLNIPRQNDWSKDYSQMAAVTNGG